MTALVGISGEAKLTQGVVLDQIPWGLDPSPLGVVLSNPCDLQWDKASFVIVSALIPAKEVIRASSEFENWAGEQPREGELSKKRWESLSRLLLDYIRNDGIRRYFLIESDILDPDSSPLVADFQHLHSIQIEEASRLPIYAMLPPPNREKMIIHFASYMSRIGVDRFSTEREQALARRLADPLRPPEAGTS